MNSDCGNIIRQTVKKNVLLAVGIVIAVCGAVVISLLPPRLARGISSDAPHQHDIKYLLRLGRNLPRQSS